MTSRGSDLVGWLGPRDFRSLLPTNQQYGSATSYTKMFLTRSEYGEHE